MERRFSCTACGKCCFGWLTLTLKDALAHAGRFPLAVIWTPVRQGTKSFSISAQLGLTLRLRKRRKLAVRIAPTAYIPPSLPCPSLLPDGLCSIHSDKPSRCRTMPFYPYREEGDQADLLIPRTGWLCDTSPAAPVVYRDKKIVGRQDFDDERGQLISQAPALRSYGEWLLASSPPLKDELIRVAAKRTGGHVVVNFSTLLPHLPKVDVVDFAHKQFPVLAKFAEKTSADPALAEYHRLYLECAAEMESVLKRRPSR